MNLYFAQAIASGAFVAVLGACSATSPDGVTGNSPDSTANGSERSAVSCPDPMAYALAEIDETRKCKIRDSNQAFCTYNWTRHTSGAAQSMGIGPACVVAPDGKLYVTQPLQTDVDIWQRGWSVSCRNNFGQLSHDCTLSSADKTRCDAALRGNNMGLNIKACEQ